MVTIDDLADDVLLEIFGFFVVKYQDLDIRQLVDYDTKRKIESWQLLVHVCRRWRDLVLGSPRHLNLQICCRPRLFPRSDVWPPLPLLIWGSVTRTSVHDVIAELKHSDRIYQINLKCNTSWELENIWTAMQVPFPELAIMNLSLKYWTHVPVLPDSFLGGSAPRLRLLRLNSIPFPGLPNLLSSATHLVHLRLRRIPLSAYISPEALATCLSTLTSLETLSLGLGYFESPDPSRRPFSPIRSVLPTLAIFRFSGVINYLEEFVARIDTPRLSCLSTRGIDDIDFDTPELNQFISRTPTLTAYDEAHLFFYDLGDRVRLVRSHPEPSDPRVVEIETGGQKFSNTVRICTLLLRRLLLTTENLYIGGHPYSQHYYNNHNNTEWLDLLLPFTAVKNLYLSKLFSTRIALVLQELTGERTTEVLPALQNVFLEGFQPSEPVEEGIARFISARQLINHPVSISVWDGDPE